MNLGEGSMEILCVILMTSVNLNYIKTKSLKKNLPEVHT